MGMSLTALTKSGLKDWLIQRVSAIILLVYIIFLGAFFVMHLHSGYAQWHRLFTCEWVRIFTLLALFSLIAHAWVGIWTIFTDYIHCSVLRGILQILVILAFIACVVWGINILWGF